MIFVSCIGSPITNRTLPRTRFDCPVWKSDTTGDNICGHNLKIGLYLLQSLYVQLRGWTKQGTAAISLHQESQA